MPVPCEKVGGRAIPRGSGSASLTPCHIPEQVPAFPWLKVLLLSAPACPSSCISLSTFPSCPAAAPLKAHPQGECRGVLSSPIPLTPHPFPWGSTGGMGARSPFLRLSCRPAQQPQPLLQDTARHAHTCCPEYTGGSFPVF